MEAVDYSKLTIDELVVMDKVDICQVKKHFKDALINLDVRFIQFKGHAKMLIVGQWIVYLDYAISSDMDLDITKVKKITETLEEEYHCTPREVNEFLDDLKKDRMRIIKGYTLVINGNFDVYDEDTYHFADSLSGSCMNGCAKRYYDLQNCLVNPADLQIASLWDYEGYLVARTLIWKGSFYDRIYANNSALVAYVKTLLNEKGFSSVYYSPMVIVDIPLSKELGDYLVPYMDSVAYYRKSPLQISTESDDHYICLREVDGESFFNVERCNCCGSASDMHYMERTGNYVCSSCSGEIVYTTDTDQYEFIDDCVCPIDRDNEWYYYTDDLYIAVDTNDFYKDNADLYYTEDSEEYYTDCDNLYFAVDTGNYYKYSDDLYFAEDTREWYEYSEELFYNARKEIYIKGDL